MATGPQQKHLAARALFLAAALLSFGLSVVLYFSGEESDGIFVGLWVPSILALGAFMAPRREPEPPTAPRPEDEPMIGIFIYGMFVFALVCPPSACSPGASSTSGATAPASNRAARSSASSGASRSPRAGGRDAMTGCSTERSTSRSSPATRGSVSALRGLDWDDAPGST